MSTFKFGVVPSRLLGFWDLLRTSFWFLPSMMAIGAAGLSFALVAFDSSLDRGAIENVGLLYGFGSSGARAILSAIASSMITVAGLTFSMTMLTLQLASSQFGPRLLRSFMSDRGNQIVLGTFTSTFLYCLLVLRTVHGSDNAPNAPSFVPHVAVAFGVLLAVISLGILIFFIHHVANSIRIETVLASLASETRAAIDRLYPEKLGHEPEGDTRPEVDASVRDLFDRATGSVAADGSGYVQRIDDETIMEVAAENDLVIRIEARPGSFVTEGAPVLLVVGRGGVPEECASKLAQCFIIGAERTPAQDLEFSIRRIVEIAQRALSPGVNDPTTALYCIDRLEEALCRLAGRKMPSALRVDGEGRPRVLTSVYDLEEIASSAIAAIARYATEEADVIGRLLEATDAIGRMAPPRARHAFFALRARIVRASRLTEIDRHAASRGSAAREDRSAE